MMVMIMIVMMEVRTSGFDSTCHASDMFLNLFTASLLSDPSTVYHYHYHYSIDSSNTNLFAYQDDTLMLM